MSEQRDLELNEWLHERLFDGPPVCRDAECLGGSHWHGSRGATYRINITLYDRTGEGMLAVLGALRERGFAVKIEAPEMWAANIDDPAAKAVWRVNWKRVDVGSGWSFRESLPEGVAIAAVSALTQEAESR